MNATISPVTTDCYIGTRPDCGCIAFWASDDLPATDLRRDCMKAMKRGLHISRANTDEIRGRILRRCERCGPTLASSPASAQGSLL